MNRAARIAARRAQRSTVQATPAWMEAETPAQRHNREHTEARQRRQAERAGREHVPRWIARPEMTPVYCSDDPDTILCWRPPEPEAVPPRAEHAELDF